MVNIQIFAPSAAGKTTLAYHIAKLLRDAGLNVAVCDEDLPPGYRKTVGALDVLKGRNVLITTVTSNRDPVINWNFEAIDE